MQIHRTSLRTAMCKLPHDQGPDGPRRALLPDGIESASSVIRVETMHAPSIVVWIERSL